MSCTLNLTLIFAAGASPPIEQNHPAPEYVADARAVPVEYSQVAPLMPASASDIVALSVMVPL